MQFFSFFLHNLVKKPNFSQILLRRQLFQLKVNNCLKRPNYSQIFLKAKPKISMASRVSKKQNLWNLAPVKAKWQPCLNTMLWIQCTRTLTQIYSSSGQVCAIPFGGNTQPQSPTVFKSLIYRSADRFRELKTIIIHCIPLFLKAFIVFTFHYTKNSFKNVMPNIKLTIERKKIVCNCKKD